MGKIACVFKLMPEDADTDLDGIKDQVRDKVEAEDIGEEDVAFGLKAIKVSAITTDEKGGTDHVENQLEEVEDVQSIELEHFDKL
ncbi:MAG: elongation factor 1-beta [Candidatus Nanohaloarchaea archaeon]